MPAPRRSPRRYSALSLSRRTWTRRPLWLERLEDRVTPTVLPVTLTDPRYWGDTGAGWSLMPTQSISADGQRVVFESDAPDLVPNDTNGQRDAFLYDRGTGRVSLLSRSTDGVHPANAGGLSPRISPDGRYVAFLSQSADLVASPPVAGVVNNQADVYLRDLVTGRTVMVSGRFDGSRDSQEASANASVITTADGGAQVVWQSADPLLVSGNTNNVSDVFVRKLNPDGTLGPTRLVSVSQSGGFPGNQSYQPQMTPGGRFVLFKSDANDLVGSDNNGSDDLFVRDLQANTTKLVSADVTGAGSANAHVNITDQAISADGRYVVFWSSASNLVSQNTAFQTNAFLRDVQTGWSPASPTPTRASRTPISGATCSSATCRPT
jgi:Tol biopolymer transport system component